MNVETRDKLLAAVDALVNDTFYEETVKLPDEVHQTSSHISFWTVPKDNFIDKDGIERRSASVQTGYQFGSELVNTGMTSDRALLVAHRMLGNVYAVLNQYGIDKEDEGEIKKRSLELKR